MLPHQLSVRSERTQQPLREQHIDVAGLGIHRRGRGRVAQVDGVGKEVRFAVFPDQLAGGGIDRDDGIGVNVVGFP